MEIFDAEQPLPRGRTSEDGQKELPNRASGSSEHSQLHRTSWHGHEHRTLHHQLHANSERRMQQGQVDTLGSTASHWASATVYDGPPLMQLPPKHLHTCTIGRNRSGARYVFNVHWSPCNSCQLPQSTLSLANVSQQIVWALFPCCLPICVGKLA